MPKLHVWILSSLLVLPFASVRADDKPENIDWDRVKAIYQKQQAGEKVSEEDSAYLEHAKEVKRAQAGQGGNKDANASGIDFEKAKALMQKRQAGETLTEEEQQYLRKAIAVRQQMQQGGGAKAGGDIDFEKAKALYQKKQNGETLTAEEQQYLQKAMAARQQGGGGQKAGQNQGQRPDVAPPPPPRESTGLVPLTQMKGDEKHKGVDGGLYGGGSNVPPEKLMTAAMAAAGKVVPLAADGAPSPEGKIVLVSMGMSNTTMEFSAFKKIADADSMKNPKVQIVDLAQGGKDAPKWNSGPAGDQTWAAAEQRMQQAKVTDQQVQVIWLKQALVAQGRFGEFPKHSDQLKADVEANIEIAKKRFPNLKLVYLSSRIYAGYATTSLNPEPYAYEGAFAMRGVIEDELKGDLKGPVVLWGPYLWADGTKGRTQDSLVWKREDLTEKDGTHPSESGRQKVAELLLNFLKTDVTAKGWFIKS